MSGKHRWIMPSSGRILPPLTTNNIAHDLDRATAWKSIDKTSVVKQNAGRRGQLVTILQPCHRCMQAAFEQAAA
jgi:hypothetical protein